MSRSAFELSMSQSPFAVVILAAGSGTRMKSAVPKVLHAIAGRPMIAYPHGAVRPLSPALTVVVVRPQMSNLAQVAGRDCGADPPLGIGDAVRAALAQLGARLAPEGDILTGTVRIEPLQLDFDALTAIASPEKIPGLLPQPPSKP
jgi:hypothetical protein